MNIEKLKASVKGAVIPVFDPSFKAASEALLWNGRKQSAQPRLIVKATCIPDVIATVRFAAEAGLRVSPRGGGHNFSGIAQQDGIVLDLGALNRIWIDRSARIAEVGPAATNADLASALEAQGLAFPVGHCASVPMSGYLLGGGFGWNSGSWGYGFSNVESIDVVLADGVLRRVSETEHADIFWAARGAGPEFFGVVVGYRLRLKPLPLAITTVVRVYPLTAVKDVLAWMKAAMDVVPNFVEFTAAMQSAPGSDGSAKVLVAIATVFADDPAEASAIHGRIAALAPEGAFDVQPEMPTPIGVLYEIIGQFFPSGASLRGGLRLVRGRGRGLRVGSGRRHRGSTFGAKLCACHRVVAQPPDPARRGLLDVRSGLGLRLHDLGKAGGRCRKPRLAAADDRWRGIQRAGPLRRRGGS